MWDGLYMFDPGSGTIRRCGLAELGVSLWVSAFFFFSFLFFSGAGDRIQGLARARQVLYR